MKQEGRRGKEEEIEKNRGGKGEMRRQRKEGEERSERCVLGDESGSNQPGHLQSRLGLFR